MNHRKGCCEVSLKGFKHGGGIQLKKSLWLLFVKWIAVGMWAVARIGTGRQVLTADWEGSELRLNFGAPAPFLYSWFSMSIFTLSCQQQVPCLLALQGKCLL